MTGGLDDDKDEGSSGPAAIVDRFRDRDRAGLSALWATSRSARSRRAFPLPAASIQPCIAAAAGRCGSTPASPRPRRATAAISLLLARGQTGLSVAFDLPTQLGLDSDDERALGEVGRVGVPISHPRRYAHPLRRHRPGGRHHLDDDQCARLAAAADVPDRGRRAGRRSRQARRHDPERHPQGIRRARHLHLPAAPFDAAGHRHLRLLRRVLPVLEHDLDLRLSHAGGRMLRRAGDRLHAREWRSPMSSRARGWSAVDDFAPRLSFFFCVPQQLLRGGGQVPRRPPDVGADHAGASSARPIQSPGRCVSTPRPAVSR